MAARWGTGEEMLKAYKLEYFTSTVLDESEILQEGLFSLQHNGLDTGDALEALHGCLDPSILSIFEDSTYEEVKSGVDEESEATLLTALTEILDNVDDENLSPFDTLPDMELLQSQKAREHSPLRKLLSISCSPETESMCNSKQFLGKRHDGGEDDPASFSKLMQGLDVSSELDWCLPISLEQDGETVSVTLSDLVKHMHPYAMTLCVEGEEQLLPEGGIILEVMDKGEHGEPILSIPDLSLPLSLNSLGDEQSVLECKKAESNPRKVIGKHKDASSEVVVSGVLPIRVNKLKNELPVKRPSKKKKKRTTEGQVLRSRCCKEAIKDPSKERKEQKTRKKVSFAPALTVHENLKCPVISLELITTGVQESMKIPSSPITTTENPVSSQVCTEIMKSRLPVPNEKNAPSESSYNNYREVAVCSKQQSEVSQPSEPKQKSLSLQQYRLLRQQKKPCPVGKVGDNSTKWPMLQEAPKELPPIPCLSDLNPKDPRCAAPTPLKKQSVPEIMPAWQPRGPGAPPTPQALLVPPASMLAASKKTCKSVSPPPTRPAETVSQSSSSSTQPSPPTPPIPTHMAEDSNPNTVSQAARQASPKITQSLPRATTVMETLNLKGDDQEKCLQNTPSALYQATVSQFPAFSKVQETFHAQVVPEIIPITTKPDIAKAASNMLNAASLAEHSVKPLVSKPAKATQSVSFTKPTAGSQRHVAPIALQPFASAPIQARIMKLAEQMRKASVAPKARSPSADLIQSFTSEIGIEASDLTSLLEQFEETQTKEEQNIPAVCGRAAAVGNSSVERHGETTVLKKTCSSDLGSTAGLTPPATPPHQMWKPLAPVALLEKPSKTEIAKSIKAIQIEPLPLHASKLQSKTQPSVTIGQFQPFSLDHDYCLQKPSQNKLGDLCTAKQQQNIIKSTVLPSANNKVATETESKLSSTFTTTRESCKRNGKPQHLVCASQSKKEKALATTGLVTPDASPDRLDSERFQGYSRRSLSPCHQKRGRTQRKYRTRLPSRSRSTSSSSESSRSHSPPKKRCRSRSTSRSPSRYNPRSRSSSPHQRRYSCSSSDSWSSSRSRSRSHSRSPPRRSHLGDTRHISNQRCYDLKHHNEEIRRCKEKAIEERRVVYIGRIHGSMTRKELRERFSYFGEIQECTVHFREHGDNYGFVTYYNKKDAFNAIENGSKLRQPNELPFDLCFGGRRQFCRSSYADLDSNRDYDPVRAKAKVNALDFDTLLKQAQKNLKR